VKRLNNDWIVMGALVISGGMFGLMQKVPASSPKGASHPIVQGAPANAGDPVIRPTTSPSPLSSSAALPSGKADPLEGTPLTVKEARELALQFRKALRTEMRAERHRLETEFREFRQAQSAKEKEWAEKERKERRKFFDENRKGADRRKYIGEHLERKQKFEKEIADRRTQRRQEMEAQLASLKKRQAENLKKFDEEIKKKVRPSKDLWPKSGA
jgi:hypothetical protein